MEILLCTHRFYSLKMLPRKNRIVVKGSEVEEHKKKSLYGHWVLVKESSNDKREKKYKSWAKEIAERVRNGRGDGITTGPTKRFANVSGRGCSHDEVGEIFGLFENAYAVNADDNLLRLSSFRECKSLKRLSLRRNRLQSVEPVDGYLRETLICLDVSENLLRPKDLYRLSSPKIERLNVSANGLTDIPECIVDDHCFLSLELLDLSDNRLSCSRAFYLLSTLHNLQVLFMCGNRISIIPYLVTKQPPENGVERIRRREDDDGLRKEDGGSCDTIKNNETSINDVVYHVQHIPFVSLRTIDLSNNCVSHSSSMLSLICWPSLTSITITANPICLKKNSTRFEMLKDAFEESNIEIIHR